MIRSGGHALLEAIVALALLSGSGLATLAWMHESLRQLERAQQREAEARLLASAHSLASALDFSARPKGEEEVGGVKLEWAQLPLDSTATPNVFTTEFGDGWRVDLLRVRVAAEARMNGQPLRVAFLILRAVPQLKVATGEGGR
jgi:hypothetical protein